MTSLSRIKAVGRELISREPGVSQEQLRAYLQREFLVDRDLEVVLLRSNLWPLVLLRRLFRRSTARDAPQVLERIELAIAELQTEQDGEATSP